MSQTKIKRPKDIKLEVDYQKLGEVLMPKLQEAVKTSLPNNEAYEKAILELNLANMKLKELNDKLISEISQSFEEQDKRLRAIETKIGIESTPNPLSQPADPSQNPS